MNHVHLPPTATNEKKIGTGRLHRQVFFTEMVGERLGMP
jgi:hypothetical protein